MGRRGSKSKAGKTSTPTSKKWEGKEGNNTSSHQQRSNRSGEEVVFGRGNEEEVSAYYSSMIQSAWRGYAERKRYKALVSNSSTAATRIQSVWRGCMVRATLNLFFSRIARVQAMWRGRGARKEMERKKKAATTIQRYYRGEVVRRDLRELWAATMIIQASWRGRCTRVELNKRKTSASHLCRYIKMTAMRCKHAKNMHARRQLSQSSHRLSMCVQRLQRRANNTSTSIMSAAQMKSVGGMGVNKKEEEKVGVSGDADKYENRGGAAAGRLPRAADVLASSSSSSLMERMAMIRRRMTLGSAGGGTGASVGGRLAKIQEAPTRSRTVTSSMEVDEEGDNAPSSSPLAAIRNRLKKMRATAPAPPSFPPSALSSLSTPLLEEEEGSSRGECGTLDMESAEREEEKVEKVDEVEEEMEKDAFESALRMQSGEEEWTDGAALSMCASPPPIISSQAVSLPAPASGESSHSSTVEERRGEGENGEGVKKKVEESANAKRLDSDEVEVEVEEEGEVVTASLPSSLDHTIQSVRPESDNGGAKAKPLTAKARLALIQKTLGQLRSPRKRRREDASSSVSDVKEGQEREEKRAKTSTSFLSASDGTGRSENKEQGQWRVGEQPPTSISTSLSSSQRREEGAKRVDSAGLSSSSSSLSSPLSSSSSFYNTFQSSNSSPPPLLSTYDLCQRRDPLSSSSPLPVSVVAALSPQRKGRGEEERGKDREREGASTEKRVSTPVVKRKGRAAARGIGHHEEEAALTVEDLVGKAMDGQLSSSDSESTGSVERTESEEGDEEDLLGSLTRITSDELPPSPPSLSLEGEEKKKEKEGGKKQNGKGDAHSSSSPISNLMFAPLDSGVFNSLRMQVERAGATKEEKQGGERKETRREELREVTSPTSSAGFDVFGQGRVAVERQQQKTTSKSRVGSSPIMLRSILKRRAARRESGGGANRKAGMHVVGVNSSSSSPPSSLSQSHMSAHTKSGVSRSISSSTSSSCLPPTPTRLKLAAKNAENNAGKGVRHAKREAARATAELKKKYGQLQQAHARLKALSSKPLSRSSHLNVSGLNGEKSASEEEENKHVVFEGAGKKSDHEGSMIRRTPVKMGMGPAVRSPCGKQSGSSKSSVPVLRKRLDFLH